MKIARNLLIFGTSLIFLFCSLSLALAKPVPKVDNFILFADQSGSMYMHHAQWKEVKMLMVKDTLYSMTEEIPELGYTGAVQLFAPQEQILAPTEFDQDEFTDSYSQIKDEQAIFDRLTPMGPGIYGLDPILQDFSGKTAIIMFSDGKANIGSDPVMEAKKIIDDYPQVCFHVVSFADEAEGKATLEEINGMGDCVMVNGRDILEDDAAMKQFVKDVFYSEEVVQKTEPKKEVQPEPEEEVIPEAEEEVIVLRGIRFDFDSSKIKPEFEPILDQAVSVLKEHPEIEIVIEGHTDYIGSEAYNQKLSEQRAQSVYNYFRQQGISAERMDTEGYGESKPKTLETSPEARAINRRVELKVVK